jgi:hypothetical protein
MQPIYLESYLASPEAVLATARYEAVRAHILKRG